MLKPIPGAGEGPFEVRSNRQRDTPLCSKKEKQAKSNTKAKSRSDGKSVASGKSRVPPSRNHSVVDLRETINAKMGRDRDLQFQLHPFAIATSAARNLLARSVIQIVKSVPNEQIPRYLTPFSAEMRMDPLKNFIPQKFTIYDEKSNSRSHVSHVRQMMAH